MFNAFILKADGTLDMDAVRDLFGQVQGLFETTQGRTILLSNLIEGARHTVAFARGNPSTSGLDLMIGLRFVDAVLFRCDGTETHDKVALSGLLSDMRTLAQEHGAALAPLEAEQLETILQMIRGEKA